MATLNNKQIAELHKLLIDLLVVFRDVCDKEGIWYSLAFGTMLGAVREKISSSGILMLTCLLNTQTSHG